MSINMTTALVTDVDRETLKRMLENQNIDVVAVDDKTVLVGSEGSALPFDMQPLMVNPAMHDLADALGQPVSVQAHKVGEKKTVGGTEYVVTEKGWRKV